MSAYPQLANCAAFQQEQGQYLCHVYASLNSEENLETINSMVEVVHRTQAGPTSGWQALAQAGGDAADANQSSHLHVTLLRGHRAIYYHQISPLVEAIRSECNLTEPVRFCLSILRTFNNFEKTRQFMSLSARESDGSEQMVRLKSFKRRLQSIIDRFAIKLTQEDETHDTLAHCSFMSRPVQQVDSVDTGPALKAFLEAYTCDRGEPPMLFIRVDQISVRIGNKVYCFNLLAQM